MKILIFDLDGTIDKQSVTPETLYKLLNIIINCKINGGSTYVVTARRFSDFKHENLLFSHNICNDLVNAIQHVNKDKYHRWLYFNRDIKDIYDSVYEFLQKLQLFQKFEHYVLNESKKDPRFNILEFNVGIKKMLQIEEILQKYNLDYFNIYFFDDSKYNQKALDFYRKYVNHDFYKIKFIGGDNEPVFLNPKNIKLLHSI